MVVPLLCAAQFVIVLDVTIVAIALPAIQADLGMSTSALGWVITAYTLVFGGCLLAAGRLADRTGRRRVFTVGLVDFAAASLACGVAPSGGWLLTARGVQGIGAALVAPAALALLTQARPAGAARSCALGWWTAAAAGGGASGWVLGGVLSDLVDWRWVFFVNVPLCAAAAALAPRVLREWRDPTPRSVAVGDALLATAALSTLLLAFTLAEQAGPGASETLGALASAAVLLAVFVHRQRASADPLLDRSFLRPAVAEPNFVAAVLTGTTTPAMFLCILHAQHVLRLDPGAAGLLFPPFNIAVVAGSLVGPRVAAAVGEGRVMTGGLLAIAAGAVSLLAIDQTTPGLPSLVGGFVMLGTGLGVASVVSTARGTAAVAAADQGLASGLLAASAQIGTALGLGVVVPIASAYGRSLGSGAAADVAGYELGFIVVAAVAGVTAAVVARGSAQVSAASSPNWKRA
jgi:MFS family permease